MEDDEEVLLIWDFDVDNGLRSLTASQSAVKAKILLTRNIYLVVVSITTQLRPRDVSETLFTKTFTLKR